MTTILLNIEDKSLLPAIKKLFTTMKGVTVAKIEETNIPNATTIKAMKEVREGKNLHKAKNSKDLFKQLGI